MKICQFGDMRSDVGFEIAHLDVGKQLRHSGPAEYSHNQVSAPADHGHHLCSYILELFVHNWVGARLFFIFVDFVGVA